MKPGELALRRSRTRAGAASRPSPSRNLKDKAQGVLMVGYRGADMFSPDRYALELIDEASSDLGSRFFVRIREEMGLAYYVGASQMQGLSRGFSPFISGPIRGKSSR